MKHNPFYAIEVLEDTDLSMPRRIQLATAILKDAKEELQQLKQHLESGKCECIVCKWAKGQTFLIDEILGTEQNEVC